MKKLLSVLLCPVLLIPLSACADASGSTITLEGSTSTERVISALIEGYHENVNDIRINYSGTGSGAGIEAVLTGLCDIGLSSRALDESENAKGAVGHLVALDCITVIIHPQNPISDLTVQQLQQIFTGKITNWRQFGSRDAPIAVYGREAGSGTRGAFENLLGIYDRCTYTNEYGSNGDIVGNVSTNPNAIGYVSLSSVRNGAKIISLGGIICNEENVRSGVYPLQRPFLMVTDKNRPLSPQAQAFLDYTLSRSVAEYIAIAGAIAPDRSNGESYEKNTT